MTEGVQKYTGALKDETVVFFFRKHWIRYMRVLLFNLLVGVLLFFGLMIMAQFFIRIPADFAKAAFVFFVMIVSVIWLNIFFLSFINYYFDLVTITENRIIIFRKTPFLRNDSEGIDLTKIQDFGVESHGILCNYLNYGHLVIILSTSAPPVRISFVPNPHQKLEYCNRVKRDYIWRRRQARYTRDEEKEGASDYLQDVRTL